MVSTITPVSTSTWWGLEVLCPTQKKGQKSWKKCPLSRSCQPSRWETQQQQQHPEVAASRLVVGWPEVEEVKPRPNLGPMRAPTVPTTITDSCLSPQALVLLQLWAGLDVLLVSSWQELTQHVCALTKALAQRPYK